jgi:hypothetical protein
VALFAIADPTKTENELQTELDYLSNNMLQVTSALPVPARPKDIAGKKI